MKYYLDDETKEAEMDRHVTHMGETRQAFGNKSL
jgi:hypothetical protein